MTRKLLLLPLLLAPAPLVAQGNVNEVPAGACTPANPPQGGRASFSTSADNVRILLCGGVKYLFTSNRGGSIRLELRPLTPGVQMPQLREGMMGTGVEGGRSWVVDVGTTGIFEVRVQGLGGGIPVDLMIEPRIDNSADKAAKDSVKKAEKAAKEREKAAKDSVKKAEKAAKEQQKAAEKAAKEQQKAAEKAAKEAAKQQQP